MSKAHDALVAVGIRNSWHLVTKAAAAGVGRGVYIAYRATASTGDWRSPGWTVTDVHDRSRATGFPARKAGERATQKDAAIAHANTTYGTTTWGTVPGLPGDLFPTEVITWLNRRLAARPLPATA